ncbi:MAG TPA: class I SAM-dependent methyltransferase [Chloroflexota bacterium]
MTPGGFDAATYGQRNAAFYDTWVAPAVEASTQASVDFLADIARGHTALELGIGTGRVALPLAAAGVAVHGIDASPAMVERLREKPGGADVPVTIGDFVDIPVDGQFRLVYCVFNTFYSLLTQADQVRCFQNVATHLEDGGAFVLEAFVPDPTMFDRGQRLSTTRVEPDRVQLDATRHDSVNQVVTTQHILIGRDGLVLLPVVLRYAWPSELDLMARLAGLSLLARFGGWGRELFTAASGSHVSVYVRS